MPAAVTGTAEKELCCTPGGKYTQANIDANEKLPAGAKFRGLMTKHAMSPMPGDFICPVTLTKANPKVEWQEVPILLPTLCGRIRSDGKRRARKTTCKASSKSEEVLVEVKGKKRPL